MDIQCLEDSFRVSCEINGILRWFLSPFHSLSSDTHTHGAPEESSGAIG